jgi:hypothetical protein
MDVKLGLLRLRKNIDWGYENTAAKWVSGTCRVQVIALCMKTYNQKLNNYDSDQIIIWLAGRAEYMGGNSYRVLVLKSEGESQ